MRLVLFYGGKARLRSATINVEGARLQVADCKSFVWQYYEIFYREFYFFTTTNAMPLIIDCGSNVGTSCLYFSRTYPGARIIAFEADKHIASILNNNIRDNNLQGVEVHVAAVWTSAGEISFAGDGADGGSISPSGIGEMVKTIRLRDELAKHEKIDFIKMDIEGAETAVLEDCADQLNKVDALFIEYHSFIAQPQTLHKILALLNDAGFRVNCDVQAKVNRPFVRRTINDDMDFQMNIFASRANGKSI